MNLLRKWLNDEVKLSKPITSFESDFSNGYLLGELLCKLHYISDAEFLAFTNDTAPTSLLANFNNLTNALRPLAATVHFTANQAKDIVHCKNAAAMNLVYELKMASAKSATLPRLSSPARESTRLSATGAASATGGGGGTAAGGSGAGGAGGGSGNSMRKSQYINFNQSLQEDRLRATVHMHSKQKHMFMHLKKFTDAAADAQQKVAAELDAQKEAKEAKRREKREQLIAASRENRAATADETAAGETQWAKNRDVRKQAVTSEFEYRQSATEKLGQRKERARKEDSKDVTVGIAEFERNLARIGLTHSTGGGGGAAGKGSAAPGVGGGESDDGVDSGRIGGGGGGAAGDQSTEEHEPWNEHVRVRQQNELMNKLQQSMPDPKTMESAAQKHLYAIREKAEADRQARKERERRRRKVLVDQTKASAEAESKRKEEAMLEKLLKDSQQERALGEELWRVRQYKAIARDNTRFRQQQEDLRRIQDHKERLERDRQFFEAERAKYEQAVKNDLSRYAELQAERAAATHVKNVAYASRLAQRVVDISMKVITHRELHDQKPVPAASWAEWMSLFVRDRPLYPPNIAATAGAATPALTSALASSLGSNGGSAVPASGAVAATATTTASGVLVPPFGSALPFSLLSPITKDVTPAAITARTVAANTKRGEKSGTAGGDTKRGDALSKKERADKEKERELLEGSLSAAMGGAGSDSDAEEAEAMAKAATYRPVHDIDATIRRNVLLLEDPTPDDADAEDDRLFDEYLTGAGDWADQSPAPVLTASFLFGGATGNTTNRSIGSAGGAGFETSGGSRPSSTGDTKTTPRRDFGGKRDSLIGKPNAGADAKSKAGAVAARGGQKSTDSKADAGTKTDKQSTKEAALAAAADKAQAERDRNLLAQLLGVDADTASATGLSLASLSTTSAAKQNRLLGALVQRTVDVASGREEAPFVPEVPKFPIGIVLLGKPFAGKTTQAALLAKNHKLKVLQIDTLLEDALRSIDTDGPTTGGGASGGGNSRPGSRGRPISSGSAHSNPESLSGSQPPGAGTTGPLSGGLNSPANALNAARSPKAGGAAAGGRKDFKSQAKELAAPANMKGLSAQQTIAWNIKKLLAKGKTITDDLYVGLVIDALKRLTASADERKAAATAALMNLSGEQNKTSPPPVAATTIPGTSDIKYTSIFRQQPHQTSPPAASATAPAVNSGADSVRAAAVAAVAAASEYGGWVLVGFPETLAQAQLLEKELSGYEVPKPKKAGPPKVTSKTEERRPSKLARPPTPPPRDGPPAKSGIDLAIRFDAENEPLTRRALGRRIDPETGTVYHIDSNAPDDDTPAIKERLVEVSSDEQIQRKLPDRFAAYEEHADALESWFTSFETLRLVDASQPVDATAETISGLVRTRMAKQAAAEEERLNAYRAEMEAKEHERNAALERSAKVAEDAKKLVDREREQAATAAAAAAAQQQSSHANKRTTAMADRKSGDANALAAVSAAAKAGAAGAAPAAAAANAADAKKRSGKDKKGDTAPAPDPASAAALSLAAANAAAAAAAAAVMEDQLAPIDTSDLSHFAGFLDSELATLLSQRWIQVETNYSTALKAFFRQQRYHRRLNIEHFASVRENFLRFLRRPDTKSLVLADFQNSFNAVHADMRRDAQVKEELHHRTDELTDKLWEITEQRKEEAEQLFETIKEDGWIANRSTALVTLFLTLLQLELDRYYASIRVAQDYFTVLRGYVVPEERELTVPTLPALLVPAPNAYAPVDPASLTRGGAAKNKAAAAGGKPVAGSKPGTGSAAPAAAASAAASGAKAGATATTAAAPGSTPTKPAKSPTGASAAAAAGAKKADAKGDKKTGAGANKKSPANALGPIRSIADLVADHTVELKDSIKFIVEHMWTPAFAVAAAQPGGVVIEEATDKKGKPRTGGAAAGGAAGGAVLSSPNNKSGRPISPDRTNLSSAGSVAPAAVTGSPKPATGPGGAAGRTLNSKSRPAFVPAAPLPKSKLDRICDAQLREIVQIENEVLLARLKRIERNASADLANLRVYADSVFHKKLDSWVSLRIKGENSSIEAVANLIRSSIEAEMPLHYQLRLDGEDAFVDKSILTHPLPTLPTTSPFTELLHPENVNRFTTAQLLNLCAECKTIAGTGQELVSRNDLQILLLRMAGTSYGGSSSGGQDPVRCFPVGWNALKRDDFERIVRGFDSTAAELVDWRDFMVTLTMPLRVPSPADSALAATKDLLSRADTDRDGMLTREQFAAVPLSFLPTSNGEEDAALHRLLFDLFAVPYPAGSGVVITLASGSSGPVIATGGKSKKPNAGAAGDKKDTKSDAPAAAKDPKRDRKGAAGGDAAFGVEPTVASQRVHIKQTELLPYVAMLLYFCFDDVAPPFAQGRSKAMLVAGADYVDAEPVTVLHSGSSPRDVIVYHVQSFLRRANAHPARYVRKNLLDMVGPSIGGH